MANKVNAHPSKSQDSKRDLKLEVSAVIVNFNGGERIYRVLDALLRQDYGLAKILVVDNCSTDDTPANIRDRYAMVELLPLTKNIGLSAARNAGLDHVTTPLVLHVDHDIYVGDSAVSRMVAAIESHDAAVVCPRILLFPQSEIVQFEAAAPHFVGTLLLDHAYEKAEQLPIQGRFAYGCVGACLLVDREKIVEAGAFDELYFFYFEDLEFSLRVRSLGLTIWCEPSAQVLHETGTGTPGLSFRGKGNYPPRRAYLTMRNRLLTIFIHYRWRTILVLSPVFIIYELASLAASAKRRCVLQWLRAWVWQFQNFKIILDRRRDIQMRRKLTDKQLLVGGALPLAPGFLTSKLQEKAVSLLSWLVNGYWRLARHLIA